MEDVKNDELSLKQTQLEKIKESLLKNLETDDKTSIEFLLKRL